MTECPATLFEGSTLVNYLAAFAIADAAQRGLPIPSLNVNALGPNGTMITLPVRAGAGSDPALSFNVVAALAVANLRAWSDECAGLNCDVGRKYAQLLRDEGPGRQDDPARGRLPHGLEAQRLVAV